MENNPFSESQGTAPVHAENCNLNKDSENKVSSVCEADSMSLNCDDHRKMSMAPHAMSRYLNVKTAKSIAFVLVVFFVISHGILHLRYGNDYCSCLMSDGRFAGYKDWQPYSCMIHKYTTIQARNCLHYIAYWGERNHITFVGDSRLRQIYHHLVATLGGKDDGDKKDHSDLMFKDSELNLLVDFKWQPIINESVYNLHRSWLAGAATDRPNVVILASGTWSIKMHNGSVAALEHFKLHLTGLLPYLTRMAATAKVIWMLQDPVIESKLHSSRVMITNSRVDMYNEAAEQILSGSDVQIWRSSRLVSEGYNADSPDGLHAGKIALDWDVQILLNMYCNNQMNFNDGTCCNSGEPITLVQILTAVFFALCMFVGILILLCRQSRRYKSKVIGRTASNGSCQSASDVEGPSGHCTDIVMALARLGVVMMYFFLCDRTYFFMKENKYYTHTNFFLPFSYLMILGLFFTEHTKQTTILHRDETDEWKGWMQLIILVYHLTGASQKLVIYMQIRVLVSAYLALSGYGHFHYFWNSGDYSIFRFLQVLFRMNFLVIVLCFVMNRPYQFYYFVPLVSVCFVLTYATMAIWPRITAASVDASSSRYLYMVLKLVFLVTALTLLTTSEAFFEKVFLSHPIKAIFVTSDDSIHQWRFRWKIDRYSTVFGMVFAFALLTAKKFKLIDDSQQRELFARPVLWLIGMLAFGGILSYFTIASFCRDKQEYTDLHPYLCFLPILSYIVLRNLPLCLRSRYSTFFAWFGKISLELFVAQYHVWLAADTSGVLVLLPGYPVLNAVLTSFIFVCTAHEIHDITVVLAPHAVPHDCRSLIRNVICFAVLLLPIAATHGVLSF